MMTIQNVLVAVVCLTALGYLAFSTWRTWRGGCHRLLTVPVPHELRPYGLPRWRGPRERKHISRSETWRLYWSARASIGDIRAAR